MNTIDTNSLINATQAALQTVLAGLESAKKSLVWARDRLCEAQAENRKLSLILLAYVEAPDPEDCEALLKELDKPCGFRNCELTARAAKCIRAYASANSYLLEENRRLKNGANSR